jgi:murein L,D-transpeptidase YcbB/YkuD
VETASSERWTGEVGSFAQARIHLESSSLRALPEVGQAIVAHYAALPNFIWVDGEHANRKANEAQVMLERADEFGLSSADYRVRTIEDRLGEGETPSIALINFEMEFSAAALTYILDASRGRIDPNRISGYLDLPRHKIDLVETLRAIAETDNVLSYLKDSHPNNAQFRALTAELARLRSADGHPRSKIASGTFIRPGEVSVQIPPIVAAIRGKGSDELKRKHASVLSAYEGTTEYGADLVALVRDFQREQGLASDGTIGRATVKALLQESNEDRTRKIELALERLRWLPRDLGSRHVFINQPAYTVYYVEEGQAYLKSPLPPFSIK